MFFFTYYIKYNLQVMEGSRRKEYQSLRCILVQNEVLLLKKNILIIIGHPLSSSFCAALARAYGEGVQTTGAELKMLYINQLNFDPLLHQAYKGKQTLESDLEEAQALISWSHHLVLAYPVWWGTMPALLKGFIDRVFLPGFAFQYRQGFPYLQKLLRGRSASLLITMDSPPLLHTLLLGRPGIRSLKQSVLQFSGFRPVYSHLFGSIRLSTEKRREQWLHRCRTLGSRHR